MSGCPPTCFQCNVWQCCWISMLDSCINCHTSCYLELLFSHLPWQQKYKYANEDHIIRSFPKENPRPFSRPSFPFSLPLPFLFPFQSLKPQSLKPQPQKAPESSPPGFMDWTSNMSHLSKFWPWHLCYSWNEINEDRQSSWENQIIWQRMALQKLQKKQVFGASPPILRCRPSHPG